MPDLTANCAGILSPNPFWLASAPPTNSGDQIMRAFDNGWGGAVWKTIGQPIQNVSSRFGALHVGGVRMVGMNNNELITDRGVETNFREMAEVKRRYPKHAVIASLMVETEEEWREMVARSEEAGADGLELNFGCPHGMCERGMGSAVGQEPRVNEAITRMVRGLTKLPVIVKLTPNVHDIRPHGMASQRGGAHAVSLINTVKSIVGVDLDRFSPLPVVESNGTNGGYSGPAVKPIALHMVGALTRNPEFHLPISGIGGVATWRDAVEFLLMGASNVQVCTAVMQYGYRIVEDMIEGLSDYMEEKGFQTVPEMVGLAARNFVDWGDLDVNYETVARIDRTRCIGCQLCYVACRDGAHQCISLATDGSRVPVIDEAECVGCNLCAHTCPVQGCITMTPIPNGFAPATWNQHMATGAPIRPKKGAH